MKGSMAAKVGFAIAGIFMAGSVWAQMPGGDPGPGMGPGMGAGQGMDAHRPPFERAFREHGIEGRWWNNPRIAERLKLTDEQRKAMDGILYDHREKLIDLHADLEKAELAMQPLMSADEPNQTAIESQIDKVVQARAELERANARYLLAIRLKLTPDQWKLIKDFRADRGMRGRAMQHREWRQGGPGQRMGPPAGPGDGSKDGGAPPPPSSPTTPNNQ